MNSRQLNKLIRNPAAMAKFQSTGILPPEHEDSPTRARMKYPSSLADLLEGLTMMDRLSFGGVTVGPACGYTGSRTFANAQQALNWVRPRGFEDGRFPAESWRMKRPDLHGPRARMTVEDLMAVCARAPSAEILKSLSVRCPHLFRDPQAFRAQSVQDEGALSGVEGGDDDCDRLRGEQPVG